MFNSLKYAKILEDAGLPRNQAETHIQIISEVLEEELASKQDILRLETKFDSKFVQIEEKIDRLKEKFDQLEVKFDGKLDEKIEKLEYRIIVKLGSLMTVLFGGAIGIVSLIV